MIESRPEQSPEGRLIEAARERMGISKAEAGRRLGDVGPRYESMSGQRWTALVKGYKEAGNKVVRGRADTIARMAWVVGLTARDFHIAKVRPDVEIELLRFDVDRAERPEDELALRRLVELLAKLRHTFGEEVFLRAILRFAPSPKPAKRSNRTR